MTAPLGAFRDSDVPDAMMDMGVYVQVGLIADLAPPVPGVTPKGIFDENDMAIAADRGDLGVVAVPRTLTVQASAFPGVKVDDALVLTDANTGVQLQVFVSDRRKEGDPSLAKFVLREKQ